MRVSVYEVANQKKALETLVEVTEPSTVDPLIRNAALALTNDCPPDNADDPDYDGGECSIRAIYNAVKHGDERVEGLEKGLKYVSDPRWADFFSSPKRTLLQLAAGYNGEDCDGHNALIAALLGSLGFIAGFRAWGHKRSEYTHVYAVVGFPKNDPTDWVALDTTVEEAEPGWEPEGGYTLTAVMDGT